MDKANITKRLLISIRFLFISSLIIIVPSYSVAVNEDCLACHDDPELTTEDGKSLYISNEKFISSIHGEAGLACVDCHLDLQGFEDFPHPEKLSIVNCGLCHGREKKRIPDQHPRSS